MCQQELQLTREWEAGEAEKEVLRAEKKKLCSSINLKLRKSSRLLCLNHSTKHELPLIRIRRFNERDQLESYIQKYEERKN